MITTVRQDVISSEGPEKSSFLNCRSCGSPISEIQEIMGNTLLSLFKDSFKIDVGGPFKIISCFKCMSRAIKGDLNKFEMNEMLRFIQLVDEG